MFIKSEHGKGKSLKIYECSSLVNIIKAYIQEQKVLGNQITYQKLAFELRMQKSYLSKIIAGNACLNRDQAYLLSKKMKLNDSQQEYLFLLVDRERAGIGEYIDELDCKIKALHNKNTQSDSYLDKDINIISSSGMQMYYLYPEVQLFHLALAIPHFQIHPEQLKDTFHISDSLYQKIINILIELHLIEVRKKIIILLKSNLHLPQDSFYFHQWQLQMKLKSMEWIKQIEQEDKYNFTASFTATENDKDKIRIEFMKFLKRVEVIVKKAESSNLYQINFDLFKWV